MQGYRSVIFLVLIIVGTCTVHGSHVQQTGPRPVPYSPIQFATSISATNGSSLEEIMRELQDVRSQMQIQGSSGCQFSAGTYGGGGGGSFNDHSCHGTVRRIIIRAGVYIDSIQITFRLPDGRDYTAPHRGGVEGGLHIIDINVDEGERIVGVFGRSASLVDQLGFVTNKGRIFGPYGGCGGGPFTASGCEVQGIFGRSGTLIDSIGFLCSHP